MESPAEQLQRAREQAQTRLADGYAHDLIDQDALDARMDAIERATTVTELDHLTCDLTPTATVALVPAATTAAVVPVAAAARLRVTFGSLERSGVWSIAARTHVRVVLGSADLDLREVIAPPGPIALDLNIVLGSLDLIIPPGWQVESECGAILASVEQRVGSAHHHPAAPDRRGEPVRVLRLTGRVILGSINIHERLPGETAWSARWRRRRERKALSAPKVGG